VCCSEAVCCAGGGVATGGHQSPTGTLQRSQTNGISQRGGRDEPSGVCQVPKGGTPQNQSLGLQAGEAVRGSQPHPGKTVQMGSPE
jgi:hypothetical protein